jgi:hypothetical protein
MHGSLALSRGTLFVGVHAKTARVRTFDLGGRELGPSFSFCDRSVGRSAVTGLAVDADHTLWIADSPAHRVRRFSLFGREVGGLGSAGAGEATALLAGSIAHPVDVEVLGSPEDACIAVACSGESRHAVQLFDSELVWRASLSAFGEPGRPFRGVVRLAGSGERLYVAEALGRCVQVFRAGAFLCAFHLTDARGERFEPSALAPLADGRLVVGCRTPSSALFLLDGSGRVQRRLAGPGEGEGAVLDPSDVVVEPGADDRHARLYVIDRDGLRVQVFTLEGRCLGAIELDLGERGARRPRERENEGGR